MPFDIKLRQSKIFDEVVIIEHSNFQDFRGTLWTTFNEDLANRLYKKTKLDFVHDKFALNKKHVLRGIHGDNKSWKLVSCISGKVFQVVVDCRRLSDTYLKHESYELDSADPKSILIPPGFGNAFLSLTDDAVYHYKLAYHGSYHDADKQFTYMWNDPLISIQWPIRSPVLSTRDSE